MRTAAVPLAGLLLAALAPATAEAAPPPEPSRYAVVEIRGDREIDAVRLHRRLPDAHIVGRALIRNRLTFILIERKRVTFVVVPRREADKVGAVLGPDFTVAVRDRLPVSFVHPYGTTRIEIPADQVPHDRDFDLPVRGERLEAVIDALPDHALGARQAKVYAIAGTEHAHLEALGIEETGVIPIDGRLDARPSAGQRLGELRQAVRVEAARLGARLARGREPRVREP